MKLGGSIQRRRGGSGSASSPTRRAPSRSGRGLPSGAARFAAEVVGLGALGLLVGFAVATRALFPPPPPPGDLVEVPDLTGTPVERARARLTDAGLSLGEVDGLRHPSLDSGVVVGQGPLGGQLIRPGGTVRVTVSLGPLRQAVPDVSRLVLDRAVRMLEATGFRVVVDSTDSDLPIGAVVTVAPDVGSVLPVPGEVRLTVSRGPALVAMPFLLGMPQQTATDSLGVLGLGVEAVDTVFRFGRDQGLVVEQIPAADSLLPRGSKVHLSVGRKGG